MDKVVALILGLTLIFGLNTLVVLILQFLINHLGLGFHLGFWQTFGILITVSIMGKIFRGGK